MKSSVNHHEKSTGSKAPLQGGGGVGDANEGDPWLAQLFQAWYLEIMDSLENNMFSN